MNSIDMCLSSAAVACTAAAFADGSLVTTYLMANEPLPTTVEWPGHGHLHLMHVEDRRRGWWQHPHDYFFAEFKFVATATCERCGESACECDMLNAENAELLDRLWDAVRAIRESQARKRGAPSPGSQPSTARVIES
jgi:hypothetical protein